MPLLPKQPLEVRLHSEVKAPELRLSFPKGPVGLKGTGPACSLWPDSLCHLHGRALGNHDLNKTQPIAGHWHRSLCFSLTLTFLPVTILQKLK